ncbi:short-chain dehydrogenase TIC 32 B, chloroplastic-like isoform X1 [Magnolia sinica]|uniref:short-chain dehydrogenase TIC 32 B, chloroplastic-like isoform X1 n=1 Tax=Magnolia sinica TaxID=86752 RepID=UPI00265AA168|nr:short-chain dehydrogenase TIC 32 B, chloroplastic-like isoform X1 [Magnolia sinica]
MGLLWDWFGRAGPSGFGSSSTAEQVTDGLDATNLTAIVTGGTSGLGKETARVLAKRGAKVIIPARSMEGGLQVKENLLKENPDAEVEIMEMDLSSLRSVTSFARSFKSSNKHLNILINNAGIMACPFQLSVDGVELQFATNHLGHFLLTNLLLDKLKATAKETGIEGRIVNVSSLAHRYRNGFGIGFENFSNLSKHGQRWATMMNGMELAHGYHAGTWACKYKPFDAYSRSKLANVLHANELSRRLQEEGSNVTANSLHPGIVPTNISRYSVLKAFPLCWLKPFLQTESQGAATTCYVALHPNVRGITGKYYANCNESLPSEQARDSELGKRLWEFSEKLVKQLHGPT